MTTSFDNFSARGFIEIPFDEEAFLAYESEYNSSADADDETEQNITSMILIDALNNNYANMYSTNDTNSNLENDITQRIIYAPELAPTGSMHIINGVSYDYRNGELVPISPEDFNSEESWFEALYNRIPHQRIYPPIPEYEIPYDCFPLESIAPIREPSLCNEIFIRPRGPIDFNIGELTIKGVGENILNKFKKPEALIRENHALAIPVEFYDYDSILSYIYEEDEVF